MKFWIVKGNPELNDLSEMLVPGRNSTWYDPSDQAKNGAQVGDGIFFWSSRRDRFLIGLGQMGNPLTDEDESYYYFDLTYLTEPFRNKITIDELKRDPFFDPKNPDCPYFIRPGPVQTRYPLTSGQAKRLAEMILESNSNSAPLTKILSGWFPKLIAKSIPSIEKFPEESEPEAYEFPEGPRIYALHVRSERSAKASSEAKKRHQAKHNGRLPCTICEFDFSERYREVGRDFAEVHHVVPLSQYETNGIRSTLLSDLIVVCSNCHRMLHRKRPCLTAKNLEKLLVKKKQRF